MIVLLDGLPDSSVSPFNRPSGYYTLINKTLKHHVVAQCKAVGRRRSGKEGLEMPNEIKLKFDVKYYEYLDELREAL